MPLIDRSYFVGPINIPNTGQPEVAERLDLFIERYEPELLRDLLGYSLFKAFMNGLTGTPVAQKWKELLEGTEYTDQYGRLTSWMGFVSLPLDLINAIDAANTITIIVGRGTVIDPVSDTNSVIIPASLVGKDFIFEKRALSQLLPDEYSVSGNTLTLTTGVFSVNEVYFYKAATLSLNTTTGSDKRSLIANYVYWNWMKDQATQSVGLGEVATTAENAVGVSPGAKMVSAYNQMMDWVKEMVCFLDTKRADYPEWDDHGARCVFRKLWYTNNFGI